MVARLFNKPSLNGRGYKHLVATCSRNFHTSQSAYQAPRTFDNQSKIPRLPIPTLEETADKYLRSLKPLLSPKEYKASEEKVHNFIKEDGLGPVLQQRLIDYDKTQKYSWLEEIWLDKAYLEWREPILLNVNWWMQFRDPENIQPLLKEPPTKGVYSDTQLKRASGVIYGLLQFKHALDNQLIPPETMGKKKIPLCMNQYRMQFGVTRIPVKPKDSIKQEFPASGKEIMLMLEDQIYAVPVLGVNNELPTLEAIELQLKKCIEEHEASTEKQAPIGILTTEQRDAWTDAYEHLKKLDAKNVQAIEKINSALFAVCLENFSTEEDIDRSHLMFFHGNKGKNRWFDKSLQIIIMNNGRGGCNGEHSPSDAVIPAQMVETVLKKEPWSNDDNVTADFQLPPPEKITWKVDKKVEQMIADAEKRAEEDVSDMDSVLLHFKAYGSNKIKSSVMASPDAFIQMALQLAYFRTYGEPCPTYESASTRQFLHGRTETIRTLSQESLDFTQAFDNEEFKPEEKKKLLLNAIATHVKYAIDATNGKGVDRHLLGLRMMLKKGEKAEMFEDPSYIKSMSFKLSSSNVSPGDYLYGGFGPVLADGYGVNYAIGKEQLKFSISSRRRSNDTCSRSFRKVLEGTLEDLMQLFQ